MKLVSYFTFHVSHFTSAAFLASLVQTVRLQERERQFLRMQASLLQVASTCTQHISPVFIFLSFWPTAKRTDFCLQQSPLPPVWYRPYVNDKSVEWKKCGVKYTWNLCYGFGTCNAERADESCRWSTAATVKSTNYPIHHIVLESSAQISVVCICSRGGRFPSWPTTLSLSQLHCFPRSFMGLPEV